MAGDQNKFQTAMAHAKRFSEQGNWNEAIRAYRFALAEFPNNQAAILGFGQATLSAGQIKLAQKAFQQALKLDPGNHQALTYMADIYEQLGQLEAAAETHLRLGNVFAAQNDLEAAINAWQQAVGLLPDHIEGHRQLAQGLAQQGQNRPAARQWLTLAAVYQRRNDNERAMQQIQHAQDLLGDDPGIMAAIESLQRDAPIHPDKISDTPPTDTADTTDLFDFVEYTDAFAERPVFEEEEDPFAIEEVEAGGTPAGGLIETIEQNALAELANVIFEDDSNADTFAATMSKDEVNMLIVQAIDLQRRDDIAKAVDNYRQVVQAGAGRPALYFNLGLLHKKQGQYDEAAKMLKMSAQDNKYRIGSHFVLGQTYYAANDFESAIRHFVEAVKLIDLKTVSDYRAQTLLERYETLADNYITQGDVKQITNFITTLEKFFTRSTWESKVYEVRQRIAGVADDGSMMSLAEFLETPETEVVITSLAMTSEYVKRNLLMTASEECLRAIQKAPSYLRLHVRLADILLKQGHTDRAITKYLYITKVYQMRNQPQEAVTIYEKILQLAPMDVTVRSKLIDLYISHQNIEQALEQYFILADSYYQLAQVDRALEKYNEALRLATTGSNVEAWKIKILGQIGDIYNQRFNWTRATAAFEELLQLNPHDERVQRQLIDLYFKQEKTDQAVQILDNHIALYQEQDQPAKPLELLKELVSSYPENIVLRQRLAVTYQQNGMKQEAIAEYDTLGEMQLENGLRNQAAQTIQTILALGPDDAEGYRRLLSQIKGGAV